MKEHQKWVEEADIEFLIPLYEYLLDIKSEIEHVSADIKQVMKTITFEPHNSKPDTNLSKYLYLHSLDSALQNMIQFITLVTEGLD